MKKKIALLLSMIMLMACMLSACGTDPATVDYNGYSYTELEQEANNRLATINAVIAFLDENGVTAAEVYDRHNADVYGALQYYGISDAEIAAAGQWTEVSETFGTCTGIIDDSFSVTKAGNTLTTDMLLNFEKEDGSTRTVTFEVVYTYYNMEMTGVTIEPVYSLSEKMQKAGLNTLISMAIVFCVLILISILIYCFNIFPYIEKKKKEREQRNKPVATIEVKKPVVPVERSVAAQEVDDTELIAVIAAAIAASEGTTTDGFVVRSINRR